MLTLSRKYKLSLLHSIPQDYVGLLCSRLHGHDFLVEVTLTGTKNKYTGAIVDTTYLDNLIKETLIIPYHNKIINDYIEHGTGEAIASYFFTKLNTIEDLPFTFLSVQLVETRKNRFQVQATGF